MDNTNGYLAPKNTTTPQIADISLDVNEMADNYRYDPENLAPERASCNLFEPQPGQEKAENIGFKANVDQLYLWTEEESLRYLLHNIFCLR